MFMYISYREIFNEMDIVLNSIVLFKVTKIKNLLIFQSETTISSS